MKWLTKDNKHSKYERKHLNKKTPHQTISPHIQEMTHHLKLHLKGISH